MSKIFNAILKNNTVQWLDETPAIPSETSVKVNITLVEEMTTNQTKSNGQKMAIALGKIAINNNFAGLDPQKWQRDTRQDRLLPNRD